VWNPQVQRSLDVSLVHTLVHRGYADIRRMRGVSNNMNSTGNPVCFSPDGKYLAATDEHTVRIYDVTTVVENW
jgi:WD40 repeat protein